MIPEQDAGSAGYMLAIRHLAAYLVALSAPVLEAEQATKPDRISYISTPVHAFPGVSVLSSEQSFLGFL